MKATLVARPRPIHSACAFPMTSPPGSGIATPHASCLFVLAGYLGQYHPSHNQLHGLYYIIKQ